METGDCCDNVHLFVLNLHTTTSNEETGFQYFLKRSLNNFWRIVDSTSIVVCITQECEMRLIHVTHVTICR